MLFCYIEGMFEEVLYLAFMLDAYASAQHSFMHSFYGSLKESHFSIWCSEQIECCPLPSCCMLRASCASFTFGAKRSKRTSGCALPAWLRTSKTVIDLYHSFLVLQNRLSRHTLKSSSDVLMGSRIRCVSVRERCCFAIRRT